MRRLFVAAILAAGVAVAIAQDAFLKGDELAAEVAKSCKDGCVTFNRAEAEVFQREFQRIVEKAEKEAYARGVQAQRAACRSLL
jgi:hypothetical protein